MAGRVFAQVGLRQFEERNRRARPVLLQMNESAGQLDQALIEQTVWTATLRQPNLFQDLVCLIKKLPVKTLEIAQIMSIQTLALELVNDRRDFSVLLAH